MVYSQALFYAEKAQVILGETSSEFDKSSALFDVYWNEFTVLG